MEKLQKFLQHISHSHTYMYFAHPIDFFFFFFFCLTNLESGMVSLWYESCVDSYSRYFWTLNEWQNGEQTLSWNVYYWYVFTLMPNLCQISDFSYAKCQTSDLNDGGEDSVKYGNRKKHCFLAAAILLFIGKIIIT